MKIQYLFILTLLLPLLCVACKSHDSPDPASESNWNEMKWDQGKWG